MDYAHLSSEYRKNSKSMKFRRLEKKMDYAHLFSGCRKNSKSMKIRRLENKDGLSSSMY